MRYEISLELENEKIVQDYRRKCMSLLKAITEDYNPNFKEKQYGENKIKDFTFAMNLPFEKVEGSFIKLKNMEQKFWNNCLKFYNKKLLQKLKLCKDKNIKLKN